MFWLATTILGCAQSPTEADKKLATYVEQNIVLPKGSPGPQCYKRYYQVVEGAELAELADSLAKSGGRLLIGRYVRPRRHEMPGIVWVSSQEETPTVYDAGCGEINVYYIAGETPESISAICSFDVAGEIPAEVQPFSC